MDCRVPRQQVKRGDLLSTLMRETEGMDLSVASKAREKTQVNIAKSKQTILAAVKRKTVGETATAASDALIKSSMTPNVILSPPRPLYKPSVATTSHTTGTAFSSGSVGRSPSRPPSAVVIVTDEDENEDHNTRSRRSSSHTQQGLSKRRIILINQHRNNSRGSLASSIDPSKDPDAETLMTATAKSSAPTMAHHHHNKNNTNATNNNNSRTSHERRADEGRNGSGVPTPSAFVASFGMGTQQLRPDDTAPQDRGEEGSNSEANRNSIDGLNRGGDGHTDSKIYSASDMQKPATDMQFPPPRPTAPADPTLAEEGRWVKKSSNTIDRAASSLANNNSTSLSALVRSDDQLKMSWSISRGVGDVSRIQNGDEMLQQRNFQDSIFDNPPNTQRFMGLRPIISREANNTAYALGLDASKTNETLAALLPFRLAQPNLPPQLEKKLPLSGPMFVSQLVKKVYECKRMSSPHKTARFARILTYDQLVENGVIRGGGEGGIGKGKPTASDSRVADKASSRSPSNARDSPPKNNDTEHSTPITASASPPAVSPFVAHHMLPQPEDELYINNYSSATAATRPGTANSVTSRSGTDSTMLLLFENSTSYPNGPHQLLNGDQQNPDGNHHHGKMVDVRDRSLVPLTVAQQQSRGDSVSSPQPALFRSYTPLPLTTEPILRELLVKPNRAISKMNAVKIATESEWSKSPQNKHTVRTVLLDGTLTIGAAPIRKQGNINFATLSKSCQNQMIQKLSVKNDEGENDDKKKRSQVVTSSLSAIREQEQREKEERENQERIAQEDQYSAMLGEDTRKPRETAADERNVPLKPFEVASFGKQFNVACTKINSDIQRILNERSAASGKLEAAVYVVTRLIRPIYGKDGKRRKDQNNKSFLPSFRSHLRALLRWSIGRVIVSLREKSIQSVKAAKVHLDNLKQQKKQRDEQAHYQARVKGATQLLEEIVDVMKNTKSQLKARELLLTEEYYLKLRKRFEYLCGTEKMVLSLYELQEMASSSGTNFDVKLFRKIDLDRGGYLEFDEIVHSFFPTIPLKILRNMMRRFDDENDLQSTWRKKIVSENAKAALLNGFNRRKNSKDDDDGELAMSSLQLTPESKEQVALLFRATDRDGKGYVTRSDMVRQFILPIDHPLNSEALMGKNPSEATSNNNASTAATSPSPTRQQQSKQAYRSHSISVEERRVSVSFIQSNSITNGPFWFDSKFPAPDSVIGLDVFTEMVKFAFPPFKNMYAAPTKWVYKPPPECALPTEIVELQRRLALKPGYVK